MIVHALQFCASSDPRLNFTRLKAFIEQLPEARPCLVCLPESWLCFAKYAEQALAVAEEHQYWRGQLGLLCKEQQIWLAAGTIPVLADKDHYFAASFLFDDKGRECAQYNKIHLFDVTVADNTGSYYESKHTQRGEQVVVAHTPFAKLGLSVCYDMRFGELYREQVRQGAQVLLVPSAFTVPTGRAHWHTLLRARAIESQVFVIAAGLYGRNDTDIAHDNGRETYGHSVIISPWGEVLAEHSGGEGWLSYSLDMNELIQCSERMPMQAHRQARKVNL